MHPERQCAFSGARGVRPLMDLIGYCRDHSIAQILQWPDVVERVELYFEHKARAREQIQRCATVHGNLVVLDLRGEDSP